VSEVEVLIISSYIILDTSNSFLNQTTSTAGGILVERPETDSCGSCIILTCIWPVTIVICGFRSCTR
jgi:hypothetical protein